MPPGEYQRNLDAVLVRAWLVFTLLYVGQWAALVFSEGSTVLGAACGLAIGASQVGVSAFSAMRGHARPLHLVSLFWLAMTCSAVLLAATWHGPALASTADGLLLLITPALAGFSALLSWRAFATAVAGMTAVAVALTLATGQFFPVEQLVSSGFAGLTVVVMAVRVLQSAAIGADRVAAETSRGLARSASALKSAQADARASSVIHETVLGALVAVIQATESTSPRLRMYAADAWHVLGDRLETTGDNVDLSALLATELRRWPVTVTPHLASVEVARMRGEVASATCSAVRAALDNVGRHSGADEAVINIRWNEGQLEIEIRDEGVGFDQDVAMGVGMRSTLSGRIELHGGNTTIKSSSGAGTTVLLSWPPESLLRTVPEPHTVESSWITKLGLRPRRVWATYMAPQVLAICFFAVVHSDLSPTHSPLGLVLALQIAISAASARALAKGDGSRMVGVALAAGALLPLVIGLAFCASSADGFAYWPIEGATFPLAALGFLQAPRFSFTIVGIAAMIAVTMTPPTSSGAAIGGGFAIVVPPAVTFMHRRASSRVRGRLQHGLDQLRTAEIALEETRALAQVEGRRLGAVRETVAPFLKRLASGSWASSDTEEAQRLYLICRFRLELPTLMDDSTTSTVHILLDSGVKVTMEGTDPSGAAVTLARNALHLVTPASPLKLNLTFASTPMGSDLQILARGSQPIVRELAESLAALGDLELRAITPELLKASFNMQVSQPKSAVL